MLGDVLDCGQSRNSRGTMKILCTVAQRTESKASAARALWLQRFSAPAAHWQHKHKGQRCNASRLKSGNNNDTATGDSEAHMQRAHALAGQAASPAVDRGRGRVAVGPLEKAAERQAQPQAPPLFSVLSKWTTTREKGAARKALWLSCCSRVCACVCVCVSVSLFIVFLFSLFSLFLLSLLFHPSLSPGLAVSCQPAGRAHLLLCRRCCSTRRRSRR